MDKNDAMKGIKHRVDKNNGDIVIQTPGVYFIVAAAQVGRESGKSDDYVDLWLRVNGKDLAHSNTRQSVDNPKFTAVLVSQTVLVLKANDVIHVMISVSTAGSGLGIIATAPAGEAVIPSVIFSIYRVG
jgi:hypothetical protein